MARKPSKIKVFRLTYLAFSLLVAAFSLSLFLRALVLAFKNGVMLDGTVQLIALLLNVLFQAAIVMFIVRSMRSGQTLLMKNIVFKQDGAPFVFGIVVSAVLAVAFVALSVVLVVSAIVGLFSMDVNAQLLIASVTLTLGVNAAFCFAYFVTFRHESGSFEII